MSKEVMKLALEALERHFELGLFAGATITAIREALAEQQAQQEPVAIEYWLQDTMESGRWVTTDNMARATAEKMLSGEYGDVYPQGRIVEPSLPTSKPWVGLTDEEIEDLYFDGFSMSELKQFARAIEAKLREKNA